MIKVSAKPRDTFAIKLKENCPSGKKNIKLMLKRTWTVHRKVTEKNPERLEKGKKKTARYIC